MHTPAQAVAHGRAQVTKTMYNFTSEQDLKLSVGYRAQVSDSGDIHGVRGLTASCSVTHVYHQEFFGELRENAWRVVTDFEGKWLVKYDL